ncbi:glycoside hydrolase family 79 protein [Boletus edulis BED1]|uniref:Glycoside hydrolase family 79 protein n=1 Tax=Boletus edulis BED1 TaxID=1328754 RepID=A0AAD4BG40_BOLED|nr:glycoside hydrolase family 79 protein [Boletus edulis BED1]
MLYQVVLLASTIPFAVSAVDVTIPLSAPSGASSVAPDLVSLSIEQDRWVDWAGTTEQNQFFYNALDNLAQITNLPPFIRIGADSEDHTDFSYDVEYEEDIFPASSSVTPYPEASNITVGQGFYDVISHLPFGKLLVGTRVHWGVNLRQYNLTAAYLETKGLIQAFESQAVKAKEITLKFIEIGNEADLYHNNGGRNSSWSVFEYVPQWVEIATNVSETAGLSKTSFTKLIGGAFAGSSNNNISGFSPQAIFAQGILGTTPGALITTISQHRYSGSFCSGSGAILQDLMTKSYIRGNISVFEPDIKATFAHGLKYILGETNSLSCHGAPGVSNTAGAALWALDYSLFATQVGISRLHFHEGVGYKYNLIQPVTLNYSIVDGSPITPLPPHIQPPYYAAIISAEAIGSTGHARMVEISIDASDVSGYAIFEHGHLVRAVFINHVAYLPGAGVRSSTHIDINFNGFGPQQMEVKRLDITYANATSGVTWAGQTYETTDARVSGTLQIQTLNVCDGLDIQETEAVLLSFL